MMAATDGYASRSTQGFGISQLRGVLPVLPERAPPSGVASAALPRHLGFGAVPHHEPLWLLGVVFCGYTFAWIGHFRFERNKPATFRHPFYSLVSDFRMWWELNLGRLKFREH
jgi:hypothetical protein